MSNFIENAKWRYATKKYDTTKKVTTKDLETFEEVFLSNIYDVHLPIVPKTIVDGGANVGLASFFFKLK